ncbi:Flp family type IVb pilin [[Clostridium] cellulosi]|jgi:Flp/Fap pilin component.
MIRTVSWIASEESGQGMVEYGLILGIIALVLTIVISQMTTSITNTYRIIINTLRSASPAAP